VARVEKPKIEWEISKEKRKLKTEKQRPAMQKRQAQFDRARGSLSTFSCDIFVQHFRSCSLCCVGHVRLLFLRIFQTVGWFVGFCLMGGLDRRRLELLNGRLFGFSRLWRSLIRRGRLKWVISSCLRSKLTTSVDNEGQ
jgi:hypothetical protein